MMSEILYAEATPDRTLSEHRSSACTQSLTPQKRRQGSLYRQRYWRGGMLRAVSEQAEPVIGQFLSFLANDMRRHPEHLQTLNLRGRVDALIGNMDIIDLNAPLSQEDE